jgi:hypothetical protein
MLVVKAFCEAGPFDKKARFFQNWAYVYRVCIMPILCMQKLCVLTKTKESRFKLYLNFILKPWCFPF